MIQIEDLIFRLPEIKDLEAFHNMRNDEEAVRSLGGFSVGMTHRQAEMWLESNGKSNSDLIFMIQSKQLSDIIGHVGLYKIDYRIRSAEFAIFIGNKEFWGRGVGTTSTKFMVQYGFWQLNLNRIQLEVLSDNHNAIHIYNKIGFLREGVKRQAQYKYGKYHDVATMSLLREEYKLRDDSDK